MKKMIFVLAALFASFNAMAANSGSTWAEIFADHSLIVAAPYATTLGHRGIFNACATADEIRGLSPVKVCVETRYIPGRGDQSGETICVRAEERIGVVARRGTTARCVEWKGGWGENDYPVCTRFEEVAYEIGLTHMVDVLSNWGDRYGDVAFSKEFTIPACN